MALCKGFRRRTGKSLNSLPVSRTGPCWVGNRYLLCTGLLTLFGACHRIQEHCKANHKLSTMDWKPFLARKALCKEYQLHIGRNEYNLLLFQMVRCLMVCHHLNDICLYPGSCLKLRIPPQTPSNRKPKFLGWTPVHRHIQPLPPPRRRTLWSGCSPQVFAADRWTPADRSRRYTCHR